MQTQAIDPLARHWMVLQSGMKRLWHIFSLVRDQFSFPTLKFLDNAPLKTEQQLICKLQFPPWSKKTPDRWNSERRHFLSCQVGEEGHVLRKMMFIVCKVRFNPISETGVRQECFLGKELFFLQRLMGAKLLVNEMETVHMALTGAESFYSLEEFCCNQVTGKC